MQHAPMSRARYVQENRKMRFQEAYDGWSQGRLTQTEAALLLGQCERSFRRHIERFEADGLEGLLDKRLSQISKRRASGVEVDHVVQLYKVALRAGTWRTFTASTRPSLLERVAIAGSRACSRAPAWSRPQSQRQAPHQA
jgi:hypothetical protein